MTYGSYLILKWNIISTQNILNTILNVFILDEEQNLYCIYSKYENITNEMKSSVR